MYLNRKQLKDIKKDIQEQLNSGVNYEELYVKNWNYIGDAIYEGKERIFLDGRITTKELNNYDKHTKYTVTKTDQITFMVIEDNIISFSCTCELMDEYDDIHEAFIELNI